MEGIQGLVGYCTTGTSSVPFKSVRPIRIILKFQVHEGRSQLEVLSGSIAVFLRALDQKLHDNESLAASIEENLESLLR